MSNSTTTQDTWLRFAEWLREQLRRAVVGRTYVMGTTGLPRDEYVAILHGKAAVDRELVIRLAEVLEADVEEACRIAGYELPDDYLNVPSMMRRFNCLPKEIQKQVLSVVEDLHKQHAHLDESGVEVMNSEYIAIQGPWYDTSYWLTRFDDTDKHFDAMETDTIA